MQRVLQRRNKNGVQAVMTVFGGEETTWGTKVGGFFVTCTKCGWHSKITVQYIGGIIFKCGQCGNYHREV
jgi:hypothetical protein